MTALSKASVILSATIRYGPTDKSYHQSVYARFHADPPIWCDRHYGIITLTVHAQKNK